MHELLMFPKLKTHDKVTTRTNKSTAILLPWPRLWCPLCYQVNGYGTLSSAATCTTWQRLMDSLWLHLSQGVKESLLFFHTHPVQVQTGHSPCVHCGVHQPAKFAKLAARLSCTHLAKTSQKSTLLELDSSGHLVTCHAWELESYALSWLVSLVARMGCCFFTCGKRLRLEALPAHTETSLAPFSRFAKSHVPLLKVLQLAFPVASFDDNVAATAVLHLHRKACCNPF